MKSCDESSRLRGRGGRALAGSLLVVAFATTGCAATSVTPANRGKTESGPVFGISLGSSFSGGVFQKSSTCDDPIHDYSPELSFEHSATAASLALTIVDLDNDKVHWIQTGMAGDVTGIEQHVLVDGAREWVNDLGEATYDGPCPPPGDRHRYRLTLYALAAPPDLGNAASPATAVHELEKLSLIRGSVEATYTRAS